MEINMISRAFCLRRRLLQSQVTWSIRWLRARLGNGLQRLRSITMATSSSSCRRAAQRDRRACDRCVDKPRGENPRWVEHTMLYTAILLITWSMGPLCTPLLLMKCRFAVPCLGPHSCGEGTVKLASGSRRVRKYFGSCTLTVEIIQAVVSEWVSEWVWFNVPTNTLQVITETSLSSQPLALVLTN